MIHFVRWAVTDPEIEESTIDDGSMEAGISEICRPANNIAIDVMPTLLPGTIERLGEHLARRLGS